MLAPNIIAPLLSRWNAYVEVEQNPTSAKLYPKAPFPVSAIRVGLEVKVCLNSVAPRKVTAPVFEILKL
jgi:hypothetical protein